MLDRASMNLASNIKQLREARAFTQQKLAKLSNVPRPTIANLESGAANPTLSVLVKIAAALRVTIEELIGAPRSEARFYPAGKLPTRQRGGGFVRKLLPDPIPAMQIDRIELPSGARIPGSAHAPGTREYLICESGDVELGTAGELYRLAAGDLIAFRADQKHSYANRGRRHAVAYSIVVLPPIGT